MLCSFRIWIGNVKMENKPPKTSPFVGLRWPPYKLNTAMLRPTARTTANRNSDAWGTVAHRPTPWSPHWIQWRAPNALPKVPLPVDRSANPTTCIISEPVRPMDPIRRLSTMHWTDRPTDRQIAHGKVWRWAGALRERRIKRSRTWQCGQRSTENLIL